MMDRNPPTYCCDICQVPVELLQLVKMGKEYVCRKCYDDAHRVEPRPPISGCDQ
jgi:hypothetical protein